MPHWDPETRTRFLAGVRLFSRLPPEVQTGFANDLQARPVQRGEFVFAEGEPATTFNLLAGGRIKVIRETAAGQEVILRLIQPGDIFGGAGSWGHTHYPASAVAQDNGTVLIMPAPTFTGWITRSPQFALALIGELSTRLREAETRIRSLQTERVERRIARFLLHLSHQQNTMELRLSRQELADLTGTTLSTASRTLSNWGQHGLLKSGRERVRLLKIDQLQALAEATDE